MTLQASPTSLDGVPRLSHHLAALLPRVAAAESGVQPEVRRALESIAARDAGLLALAAGDPHPEPALAPVWNWQRRGVETRTAES